MLQPERQRCGESEKIFLPAPRKVAERQASGSGTRLAAQERMRRVSRAVVLLAALGVIAAGGQQLPGAFPNPTGEARTLAPVAIDTGLSLIHI